MCFWGSRFAGPQVRPWPLVLHSAADWLRRRLETRGVGRLKESSGEFQGAKSIGRADQSNDRLTEGRNEFESAGSAARHWLIESLRFFSFVSFFFATDGTHGQSLMKLRANRRT